MKNFIVYFIGVLLTWMVMQSCSQESGSEVLPGDVPIQFSVRLEALADGPATKVTSTAFEEHDQIGLFAMLPSSNLSGSRYIDNLLLESTDGVNFTPQQIVYYPEGNASLNFVAYYTYQSGGMSAGSSVMEVSVLPDQSVKENFSQSDFLLAKREGVTGTTENVELVFEHKLSKLKIILTPGEGEDLASMRADDPRIIVTGIKTKVEYNLEGEAFDEPYEARDVVAYGTWEESEDGQKLIGKELIIVPQTLNGSNQSIIIEWNGRIYTCSMPAITIGSGQQCEITIEVQQKADITLGGIAGSITGWTDTEGGSSNNGEDNKAIYVSSLSFTSSNIYRVYNAGRPVGEICKEYLISEALTSRAIVYYPVNSQTDKADLQKGTLLQLLDTDEALCGSTISWPEGESTFAIQQEEDKSRVDKFYVAEDGTYLENSSGLNAIVADISSYRMRDIRGEEVKEYPLVKVGTQYWMQEDLQTTCYRDGSALIKKENLGEGAGYFNPDDTDLYFYNGEAVLEGDLAPKGWKIPTSDDWDVLNTYIKQDVSVLKIGIWSIVEGSSYPSEVTPITNLTGLSIYPQGIWMTDGHYKYGALSGFWSMDEAGEGLANSIIYLIGNSNTIVGSGANVKDQDYYKALSIRCIKE